MADDGDYAFVVYVENRFLKTENQKDEEVPIIKVTHHLYDHNNPEPKQCKNGSQDHTDDREEPDAKRVHFIKSRDALCFPLYWKKEYLEITLKKRSWRNLPNQYHIWSGPMAKVKLFIDDKNLNENEKGPYKPLLKGNRLYPSVTTFSEDIVYNKATEKYERKLEKYNTDDDWYLEGGCWLFKKESKEPNLVFLTKTKWTLNVYKLVHDPEEENVTIGENPPG